MQYSLHPILTTYSWYSVGVKQAPTFVSGFLNLCQAHLLMHKKQDAITNATQGKNVVISMTKTEADLSHLNLAVLLRQLFQCRSEFVEKERCPVSGRESGC